ncbi:MAG: ribosome maturation factor RimP [Propionibacteriaceae bacterium]|jgi:ribosome maturation factor RimP|nr:ribosome maturation factor RimP [Propionibacteriaceae bacterium]
MNKQALAGVLEPVVSALNLEIDRLEVRKAGKRQLVQVFLDGDGEDGHGPSLDDIAEATRAISRALDESDVAGNAPYTLEVSTRGVNRALTEPKHFRRNTGRLVEVSMPQGAVTGRILSAGDELLLDVDGKEQALAWPDVAKAYVQVEFRE